MSTMLVAQALRRNRPRRHIKCSSRPNAWVSPIRSVSACSSASPQRCTDAMTGYQLQPNSEATSLNRRPRPAWRVTQRPARVVNRSRRGATTGSCSVTVPPSTPSSGNATDACATPAGPVCRTPGGPPTPPAFHHQTTTARHIHRRPVSVPVAGYEPATVHRLRRRCRPPQHRPTQPITHTYVQAQLPQGSSRFSLPEAPILEDLSRSGADPHPTHPDLKREEPGIS